MEKGEFLSRIHSARQAWDQFLAQIPAEKLDKPSAPGAWAVKDVIAHLTWYDQEMVDLLESHVLHGSEWWDLPLDERNRMIFEEYHERPLQEVLVQSRQVYEKLWLLAHELEDEDLNDPARFKEMPLEWKPWEVIASNTYDHYLEHIETTRVG